MRKRGATYILYKNEKEVMRNNMKAISAALNRSYNTVASWLEKDITSREGYAIKTVKPIVESDSIVKLKEIAERPVRKMRTRTSSGMTKWN